jgi:hypothetical protein
MEVTRMDHGEELGVDLELLWRLATEDLPEVADRWAGANQALHKHAADQATFVRPVPMGVIAGGHQLQTTSVGRVYPYFDQLRDELQDIMCKSANNVYDAVKALVTIVNNYADEDDIAKARFETVFAQHKSGPPRPTVHTAE